MATDLSQTKALLLVFAMPGCPACHDFLPRLKRQIHGFKAYHVPFVIYEDAAVVPERIPQGEIPVFIYDATSPDPTLQELANKHNITGMPTTLFMSRVMRPTKIEGSVDDNEIYQMLVAATAANR